jgi:hypothetical protein
MMPDLSAIFMNLQSYDIKTAEHILVFCHPDDETFVRDCVALAQEFDVLERLLKAKKW